MTKTSENISSFSGLFKQLLKYRVAIFQILALQVLWVLFELIFPFLTQALVDQGINHQDIDFIYLLLIGQLFLFLGIIVSDFLRLWLLRHIGIRLNITLVNTYLHEMLFKQYLFFSNKKQGALIQHINDNLRIESFLTTSSVNFVSAVFKILVFGIVLFIFSWKIGCIFAVSFVAVILWDLFFLRYREKIDNDRFKVSSKMRSHLMEVLEGVIDIKVNNLETYKVSTWHYIQDQFGLNRLKIMRIFQIYQGFNLIVGQLRDILVLFVAAMSVINGTLTLGAMLAIQYILGQLAKPTTDIMQFVQDWQDAKLSLGRLSAVTSETEKEYEPDEFAPTITYQKPVSFQDVSFGYKDEPTLKNVSFDIPYGSRIALVGKSGSGKSTMIKLILKLITADNGLVKIGEQRIDHLNYKTWRDNCSFVSQDGFVFSDTLRYNITLRETKEEIDFERMYEAIEMSCLDKIVENLDKGVETMVGRGGKQFSRGQVQRILLARAFYKNAQYLIMDEPTSALDNVTAKKVIQNMERHFAGRTIITATHKLKLFEHVDHIIMIEDGVIIERGTYESLMAEKGEYYRQWMGLD
ncbi:MAG: ATP-binding cassette domain-containing protein [Bacteroidota bacterium]